MDKRNYSKIETNIDLFWTMADIVKRTDKAVVSKWTSANFWGFANTLETKVSLTFPRGYNMTLPSGFKKTQRVTKKYLGGIKTFNHQGKVLKIYSAERTVVELIKDAKGSYDEVLLETVKSFFTKIKYDDHELTRWSKEFKIPEIVNQFKLLSDTPSTKLHSKYKVRLKINDQRGVDKFNSLSRLYKDDSKDSNKTVKEIFFSSEEGVEEFLLHMIEHITLIEFPLALSLKWNSIISKQKYINVSNNGLVSYSFSNGEKENNDPEYTYDGTVLKNKFKATDGRSLQNLEEKISKSSIQNHIDDLRKLKWNDEDVLKTIHKTIFNDIYDWAGEFRNINISKNETNFENYVSIKSENRRLLNETIRTKHDLIGLYLKLNIVHHFREGNGRTLRLWLTIASEQLLGLTVDFSKVKPEEYMAAMETSEWNPSAVYALLDKVFVKYTEKNYMAIFMRSTDASYAYEHMSEFKMGK